MKNLLFIISILITTFALSEEFALTSTKDKTEFSNILSLIDSDTQKVIKTLKLSDSYKKAGIIIENNKSPYVFFYADLKQQGRVQIINKSSFSLVHSVVVDRLNVTFFRNVNHYFFEISPDNRHLMLFVGKKKNQKLLSVNAETGKIDNELLFDKKALILKTTNDRKYFWTRLAKDKKKQTVNLFDSLTYTKIKSLETQSKLLFIQSLKNLLFIIKQVHLNTAYGKPEFNISVLNLDNTFLFDDFVSSQAPVIFAKPENRNKVYMTGRSLTKPQKFKLMSYENGSNKAIEINEFDTKAQSVAFSNHSNNLYLYGQSSISKINLSDTSKTNKVSVPFKIIGGIISKDESRVFFNSYATSKIGQVDFTAKKVVALEPIGSTGKKIGLALFNAVAMVAVIGVNFGNSGWIIIPGTHVSQSSLMLNQQGTLLFATSSRTNDVTVLNVNDLTDNKIYPTGRGTSKIIQAGTKNAPVVVISMKRVSYFDAKTGAFLGKVKFDSLVRITKRLRLYYEKDRTVTSVTLLKVPENIIAE